VPSIAKALAKGRRILHGSVFGERSDARPKIQLSPSVGVGRGASTSRTKFDYAMSLIGIIGMRTSTHVVIVVVVIEFNAKLRTQLSPSIVVGRGASTSGTKCDRTKCDLAIPGDVVVVVVIEMDMSAEMGVEGGLRWLESL
jgi:hypothetical protein